MKPTAGGAAGETLVSIRGKGFSLDTSVRFGATLATVVDVQDDVVTALSPPGRAGRAVDVVVTNAGKRAAGKPLHFNYGAGWERAAPMVFSRLQHTATLLDPPACQSSLRTPGFCGKVLVTGGHQRFCIGCIPMNSAELYDPARDIFELTGFMHQARMEHTATMLADGTVLVAGGKGSLKHEGPDYEGEDSALRTAETYDPATGTWTAVGDMAAGRFGHTATLLSGASCQQRERPSWCDKVLVVGGATRELDRPPIASAELYDPATRTWSSAGSLSEARANHTASALPDGRVLVVGGLTTDKTFASTEIYDPTTNSWSAGPAMGAARALHTATTLPNGRVLVVGGFGANISDYLRSAEIYDPTTNSWGVGGLPINARAGHTATLLASGRVLVAGGGPGFEDPQVRPDALSSAEVFDPTTLQWTVTRSLNTARGVHTAVALDGPACRSQSPPRYCGAVVVSGGAAQNSDPSSFLTDVSLFTSELYR